LAFAPYLVGWAQSPLSPSPYLEGTVPPLPLPFPTRNKIAVQKIILLSGEAASLIFVDFFFYEIAFLKGKGWGGGRGGGGRKTKKRVLV